MHQQPLHRGEAVAATRLLAAALERAVAGRDDDARAALRAAIAARPCDEAVRIVAARVLFALGDFDAALSLTEALVSPAGREVGRALAERSGRTWRARGIVARTPRDGGNARTWLAASAMFERRGTWELSLAALRRAAEALPASPRRDVAEAGLLLKLGRPAEARAALSRALALSADDALVQLEAATLAVELGDLEDAAARACAAVSAEPASPRAHVAVGTLALWAGDDEKADAAARAALACDSASPEALRLAGALAIRARRFAEGRALLDGAIRTNGADHEAFVWRGESFLRDGRWDEAIADFERASAVAPGFLLAARAMRLLAAARSGALKSPLGRHGAEELAGAVKTLLPAAPEDVGAVPPLALADLLEALMARLGGNRSATPTTLTDGKLTLVRSGATPRRAAREALEAIQGASEGEVLERFERVLAAHPHSSLPFCHRGELFLWLGRYERARIDLERALEIHPGTRWAYIGLTMLAIVEGRHEDALAVSARGVTALCSTGGAVYVHRGEAYRKLGRLPEARADLERACALHPRRVSAFINLALTLFALGDPSAQAALFARLRPRCGALFQDAAAALGARAVPPDPDADLTAAVLAQSLSKMRGNRSSSAATYFVGDELRVVPHAPPLDDRGTELARVGQVLRSRAVR